MGKIIDIDYNQPHFTGELVCLACGYRALNQWNAKSWLRELVCPQCGTKGGMICTGQVLPDLDNTAAYGPYAKPKPGHVCKIIEFKRED